MAGGTDFAIRPTGVTFRESTTKSNLKAYVEITFNDILTVRGFRLVDGRNGLFLGMPNHPDKNDPKKFYNDIYIIGSEKDHTLGREFSNRLNGYIISEWQKYQQENASFQQGQSRANVSGFDSQTIADDNVPF